MLGILHTIWLKLNPQNICDMGGFIEAISLCLNLVPDDGFLPYSMPEVFNKTEHDFTGIIIACAEFKPVLHQEIFWVQQYIYLLCTRVELNVLHHSQGICQKRFQNLEFLDWLKMHFLAGLKSFHKSCSKKFDFNIWVPIPI